MSKKCELCGSSVVVTGNTTLHYEPAPLPADKPRKTDLFDDLAHALNLADKELAKEGKSLQVTFTGWKAELEVAEKRIAALEALAKQMAESLENIKKQNKLPMDAVSENTLKIAEQALQAYEREMK